MRIHNRAGWSVNIEHPLLPQLAPVSLSLHVSYGPPRCTIDGLAATVQQAQRYYDQGRTMSSVMNMRGRSVRARKTTRQAWCSARMMCCWGGKT